MNRRGFTIVEVLVAVVLLGIGVLGVAGVSAMSLRQTADADQQNVGALVAQSYMERYRGLSCGAIDTQLASVLITTDRNVAVRVERLNTGFSKTKVIAGRFSWVNRRNQPMKIEETTTVNCK